MYKDKSFRHYKIITLLSFAIMYNFVYAGRFNIANLSVENFSGDIFGFMNQEILSLGVLFSYGIGSVINGRLADRHDPKSIIVIGSIFSILVNSLSTIMDSLKLLFIMQLVNGYFQSMIWVGGIVILVQWWPKGRRGKGLGFANFFSGMSHVTSYLLPILMLFLLPALTWKDQTFINMTIWGLTLLLFGCLAVTRPENVNLPAYGVNIKEREEEESLKLVVKESTWFNWLVKIFTRKKFLLVWCLIAMSSSMCRYGLLRWIPVYFNTESMDHILSPYFSNLTLPIGMSIGTLAITWYVGSKQNYNKGLVIVWAGTLCGSLVMVFPMAENGIIVTMAIFFIGFFLYGINGILWLYAMDSGYRYASGTIAGILNGSAYFGAGLETLFFPMLIKETGSIILPFVIIEILCIVIIICGVTVSNKDTLIEPEIRE